MSAHAPLKAYSALEAFAWALLFATALLIAMDTWNADFPARARALGGEAMVLALSAAMAALASARVFKKPPADEAQGVPLLGYALLAARVFVLLPVVAFFLIAAAAGFAA